MWQEISDSKYDWFVNNVIIMKFNCATDKVYETIKNVILLAFSMFLFFLQYSYYYSIFYFPYFCIFVFDVFLIQFDYFQICCMTVFVARCPATRYVRLNTKKKTE